MTGTTAQPEAQAAKQLEGPDRKATIADAFFRRLDLLLGMDVFLTMLASAATPAHVEAVGHPWCSALEMRSAEVMNEGTRLAVDRTQLAGTRTNLALTRNAMAAERTLMAWIRTCLAMISFGFTIGKLDDALASSKVSVAFGRTTDIAGVADFLVCLGTLALILAAVQYRFEVARLTPDGFKRRPSLALVVAVLLSLLGVFAFTDLVGQL